MSLPQEFSKIMSDKLGDEYLDFEKSLKSKPPISVRFNPDKNYKNETLALGDKVPWSETGFYLKKRPIFTLDPCFHAGAYYVQEASSMFIEFALKQLVDFSKPLKVLDMCAAPGGKTTILASLLNNDSILVANEAIKSRIAPLKENLIKWGYTHVIYSNQDPETFADLEGFFDIVLVDAPCSGEGLFRKDEKAAAEWSMEHVQMCAMRQKRILSAAAMLVAPDGILVFSTCTYNELENAENVKWLTRTLDLEIQNIDVPIEWNIDKLESGGYQFYPHKLKGEGFFMSVFRQKSTDKKYVKGKIKLFQLPKAQVDLLEKWINPDEFNNYQYFAKQEGMVLALKRGLINEYASIFLALEKRSSGFELGIFKGKDFVPSHAMALSNFVNQNIRKIELNTENALKFLKKETFSIPDSEEGWAMITHKKLNLGWIKNIGNRVNNYLPTDLRIRMDLE